MSYAIMACDRIQRGQSPQNEIDTGLRYGDSEAAWAAAAELRREYPSRSFTLAIHG